MPVERTVGIVRQIASGLAAAHEAGVVHRDLKPANIMIEAEGNALIMDFGIARSTSGVTGPSMTAGGAIVGTIEYMAPEQASGVTVDHRADIYSLGLILNDLLLGRRQGNSSTAVAELMARMQGPAGADSHRRSRRCPRRSRRSSRGACSPIRRRGISTSASCCSNLGAGEPSTARMPIVSSAATMRRWCRRPRRCRSRAWIGWLAAAAVVAALAGAGWAFRDQLFGRPAQRRRPDPCVSLAILPFRNASGDPTLDSHRDEPEPGAGQRARPVFARADGAGRSTAAGAEGSPDFPERDARPGRARACRRFHQRPPRALGSNLALRQRDSYRRDAAGPRPQRVRGAHRDGAQRGELSDGHLHAGRVRPAGTGAGHAGHPRGAQSDRVETVNELVRGDAPLHRRHAAHAAGHLSGSAQALRGRHEAGRQLRARLLGARPHLRVARLRRRGDAGLAARHEPRRRAAGAGKIPDRREPLPDRQRHRQGDRGVQNLVKASPNSADRAVRSGHAVRAERETSTRHANTSRK